MAKIEIRPESQEGIGGVSLKGYNVLLDNVPMYRNRLIHNIEFFSVKDRDSNGRLEKESTTYTLLLENFEGRDYYTVLEDGSTNVFAKERAITFSKSLQERLTPTIEQIG